MISTASRLVATQLNGIKLGSVELVCQRELHEAPRDTFARKSPELVQLTHLAESGFHGGLLSGIYNITKFYFVKRKPRLKPPFYGVSFPGLKSV
jgi:hypothetical protein